MRTFRILVDVVAFILCCIGVVQINHRAGLPIAVSDSNDTVYCSRVTDESSAGTILAGEKILALNGQTVKCTDEYEFQLDGCRAGDNITVTIASGETVREVAVRTGHFYGSFYLFSVILVSALFLAVGMVVWWKKPDEPVAVVYHIGSLAAALQLSTTWGSYVTTPPFVGMGLRIIFATVYAFTPALFFHLTHLFPHPRQTIIRGLVPLVYACAALLAAGSAVTAVHGVSSQLVEIFRAHLVWFQITRVFMIVVVVGGLWAFGQSYLDATDEVERRKLRWVLWGMFVGFTPFVVLWVIPSMVLSYGLIPESVMLLASGFMPLAFGASIVKYHIMDINLLLNRSLVYGSVMMLIALVYMIVVGTVALVVTNATYEISLGLSMAVAIVAALLFEPIRRVVQPAVDRRFFRVQYDFRRAARRFQEDVKNCVTIEALGTLVVTRIDTLIPVERIGLFLVEAEHALKLIAGREVRLDTAILNEFVGDTQELPIGLTHAVELGVPLKEADPALLTSLKLALLCPIFRADARLLGVLVLGNKKAGTRFTSEDVDLLRNIALQGGAEMERILLQHTIMEKVHETDRLHHLNAMKSDFVSYVSHDLRTPLTSIRMFAELLTGRLPHGDKRAREFASIISGEADRLQRMVNTILDSAKIDQGEQHYTLHPVRLDALIRDVLRTMKYQIAKEKFRVKVERVQGRSRTLHGGYVINADPDAVKEALLNLLTNAMKYSVDERKIRIVVGQSRHAVTCAIEDRGRGIPPEAMAHLFEKFYRDPSLPRKVQGVGLGLSVVKHIMDAHGGKVGVKSTPGKGSTFTLEFPAPQNGKHIARSRIIHKQVGNE